MSTDRVDAETLAAFLDGTLSPEEREQTMALLARSPEAYSVFLEASAVHALLNGADETRAVVDRIPSATQTDPISSALRSSPGSRTSSPPRRANRLAVGSLIAAGIVGIALVAVNRGSDHASPHPVSLVDKMHLVTRSGPGAVSATLGDAWSEPDWAVVRGGESAMTDDARALRLGARFTELQLALAATDSVAVRRASETLIQLLAPIDGVGPVVAAIRELASNVRGANHAASDSLGAQIRELSRDQAWFDLGVWTELARLAVQVQRLDFFAPGGDGQSALARIADVSANGANASVRRALEPLTPILRSHPWSVADADSLRAMIRRAVASAR